MAKEYRILLEHPSFLSFSQLMEVAHNMNVSVDRISKANMKRGTLSKCTWFSEGRSMSSSK